MRKYILPLLFVLIYGFLSAALGAATHDDEYVVVLGPSSIEWNPLYTYSTTEAQLYTAVYEGLVVYDPRTLQPRPGVASRWSISEDKRSYTFHLRKDARYQDGSPVTAQDFRETWELMLRQGNNSPFSFLLDPIQGAADFRLGRTRDANTLGIETPDDHTLVITLEKPAAHFLSILCHQSLVPLPQGHRTAESWNGSDELPSNGPYRIAEYTDEHIVFQKNDQYWDRARVLLPSIRVLFREDPLKNSQEFNYGSVQWIMDSFDAEVIRIPGSLQIHPQFSTHYYFFRSAEPPWDDPSIRKAIALALPLAQLRSEDVYFVPTARLVPEIPGYPEPETLGTAQNASAARALLAEAGYPLGRGLPPLRVLQPEGQESQRIGTLIKESLEGTLELEVILETLPYAQFQAAQRDGSFTLSTISWVGDFADPLTFLNMWVTDNPVNIGGYANPEYEQLLDQASLLEGEERFTKLSEAESLLLTQAALIPISHSPSINVIDLEETEGWYPNALDIHPFKNMAFATQRAPYNVVRF